MTRLHAYPFSATVFLWVTLLLLTGTTTADAGIYVYQDENGVLHFTNTPTSSKYIPYRQSRAVAAVKRTPTSVAHRGYHRHIVEAANDHGVPYALVKSIIKVESDFDPDAVSQKGAKGLMQIMPLNFKRLQITDPFDPRQNIQGGTRYLKYLLQRYHGDLELALAAYNAGPLAVDRYRKIPPFPETENYVYKVMRHYRIYNDTPDGDRSG